MPRNRQTGRQHQGAARRRSRGPRQRRLSVRSELRREPDVQKIARAVVALAVAQAEKEAAEQATNEREQSDV